MRRKINAIRLKIRGKRLLRIFKAEASLFIEELVREFFLKSGFCQISILFTRLIITTHIFDIFFRFYLQSISNFFKMRIDFCTLGSPKNMNLHS